MASEAYNTPFSESLTPVSPEVSPFADYTQPARQAASELWDQANASLGAGPEGFVNDTGCFPEYYTITNGTEVMVASKKDIAKPPMSRESTILCMGPDQQLTVVRQAYRSNREGEPDFTTFRISKQYELSLNAPATTIEEPGLMTNDGFVATGSGVIIKQAQLGEGGFKQIEAHLREIMGTPVQHPENRVPVGRRVGSCVARAAVKLFRG